MIEAIYTRRSIRYFKDEPLPEEALAEILRAGMQAPSPKNRRPGASSSFPARRKKPCSPPWQRASSAPPPGKGC